MNEVDLKYPTPGDEVSDQFPDNPFPVKVTTTNLLIGMANLYKALFLYIVLITILLVPLYWVAQQFAQSMTFYFIYRPLDIQYEILASLTFEYLVSWIPMIYILVKTKEYHENNWKSNSYPEKDWNPFNLEIGETLMEDLKGKYRYILLIVILSTGYALINLFTFIVLIFFDHLVSLAFLSVPDSTEFNFTMLFFRTASKAILLARFGLAPMYIIKGEESIINSLKYSWESTEEDPLLLFPIFMITQFLTYMSPFIFGVLNYLILANAFYLLHPHEFPRGRIWPLSPISEK